MTIKFDISGWRGPVGDVCGDGKDDPVQRGERLDVVRWRALAQKALAAAAQMTEADAQQAMLAIAVAYERLAQHAQKRAAP